MISTMRKQAAPFFYNDAAAAGFLTLFSTIFLKNVLVKDLAAFFSKSFFADSAVAQAESEDQGPSTSLRIDRPTGKIAEK